ncbi:non-hydrolyzing UDP-N-acetylglucosamine 2-epimerase [Candidatus Undinarchaeota archaeon]
MKILLSVGTRPEIIKMSPLLRSLTKISNVLFIHSGQHYSFEMDKVFLEELGLPEPDKNIEMGSGSHAEQTAKALVAYEKIIKEEKPDLVLVHGDTNTTLACALATAKCKVPLGHVEAGLRSRDRSMPEEINRILVDHASDYLFAPTKDAMKNLEKEGLGEKAYLTGNTIVDAVEENVKLTKEKEKTKEDYILITAHRGENVDSKENLRKLVEILNSLPINTVYPIHPRTKAKIEEFELEIGNEKVELAEPTGYLEFLNLLKNSKLVMTDSGGIQEEAAVLNVPCLTLRYNTERPETVATGKNVLVGLDKEKALKEVDEILNNQNKREKMAKPADFYGKDVSQKIIQIILKNFS